VAKRQILVEKGSIQDYLQDNRYLSFIMKNASVFLVRPLEIKSEVVKSINTKGHILHLPFAEIFEIWAEEKVN
jgi:hypothetical protein